MKENLPAVVDFHGTQLLSKKLEDGTIIVAMKPVVLGMGLDWKGQHEKLQSQRKRFNCGDIPMVAADGKERLMLSIPLTKLNGWLFTVNPEKIPDPSVRTTVELYQEECFQVLFDYWHKGEAINPSFQRYKTRPPSLQTVLNTWGSAIKNSRTGGLSQREAMVRANDGAIKAYGIDVIDWLGIDVEQLDDGQVKRKVAVARKEDEEATAEKFFGAIRELSGSEREKCVEVKDGQLLLHMPTLLKALRNNGHRFQTTPLHKALKKHPLFIDSNKQVRCYFASTKSESTRCWVFDPSAIDAGEVSHE